MPVCSECRYYRSIDEETGLCSGRMVQGDQDADECPTDSFVPIEKEKEK